MADSSQLLRMLEPTVRPVGGKTGPSARSVTPLEQQDFETLLSAARQSVESSADPFASVTQANEAEASDAESQPDDQAPAEEESASQPQPLEGLRRFDAIENTSLRQLIAEATGAEDTAPDERAA